MALHGALLNIVGNASHRCIPMKSHSKCAHFEYWRVPTCMIHCAPLDRPTLAEWRQIASKAKAQCVRVTREKGTMMPLQETAVQTVGFGQRSGLA